MLEFEGFEAEDLEPRWLHGLVSTWLESGATDEQHHSSRKGFTASPAIDLGDGLFGLEISLVDDSLSPLLFAAAGSAHRFGVRLGTTSGRLVREQPDALASMSWPELASVAEPRTGFEFRFATPTTFMKGRRCLPVPLPGSVFGHYRDRWNAFCPPTLGITVDFKQADLAISALAGSTMQFQGSQRTYTGFAGSIMIETGPEAGEEAATKLDALALLAQYCGTGANTTIGMGITDYHRDNDTVSPRGFAS